MKHNTNLRAMVAAVDEPRVARRLRAGAAQAADDVVHDLLDLRLREARVVDLLRVVLLEVVGPGVEVLARRIRLHALVLVPPVAHGCSLFVH